jgi:hypothetical protein
VFGACSGPCRRRFVRDRGLRARVSAGLRALFSDSLGVAGVRDFGISIIVRVRDRGHCPVATELFTIATGLFQVAAAASQSSIHQCNCSGSGLTTGPNRGIIDSSLGLPPVHSPPCRRNFSPPEPEHEQLFCLPPAPSSDNRSSAA